MTVPELVAHRGYPLHFPENTLPGIEAAIQAGARFLEIDIQLTKDQLPVLFHDRDLRRVCGVRGTVHDYTLAQLQTLRASEFDRFGYRFAQVHVPSLVEFGRLLQRFPDVTAFIELKRSSIERFGSACVLNRALHALKPVLHQCVPISYALDALIPAHGQDWHATGAILRRWRDRKRDVIRELAPQYVFCDVADLPYFGRLHVPGARLVVFEIDNPEIALRLAARGVDLIETFAFAEMSEALAVRAAAP